MVENLRNLKLDIVKSIQRLFGRQPSSDRRPQRKHIENGEFLSEFMFSREGYSIHSVSSFSSNDNLYFIVGSKVGGIKVFNQSGLPIVENNLLTASLVHVIYCTKNSFFVSCGKDSAIPMWKIEDNGKCDYATSFLKHTSTVNIIDSIYVVKCRGLNIVSGTNYFASGGSDHTIVTSTLTDGGIEVFGTFHGHSSRINELKFYTIDQMVLIASGDDHGNLLVWDIFTQSIYFSQQLRHPIRSIATSSRKFGSSLVACVDTHGDLYVWDTCLKGIRFSLRNRHYLELIRTILIHDDREERLLLGGCDNGCISIWSLSSGAHCYQIIAHHSWVTTLHILDGNNPVMASGGCDSKVKCWDLKLIHNNIKYKRRKNFLMFLVGCRFISYSYQSLADRQLAEHESSMVNNVVNESSCYFKVFSKIDLNYHIAKFL